MHSDCPPDLQNDYRRAVVCQTFPAYKLEDLSTASASRLLRALTLVNLANQVQR